MSPILTGIVASGISGNLYNASYESISTVTLGSTQTQIELANIPTTYEHLQIRISGRSTGAYTYSSAYLRLNNDAGNNYTYHSLLGDGTSAQSYGRGYAGDNIVVAQNITGATSLTDNFGAVIVDIVNYANTSKLKTIRSFGGYDNNGSGTPIGTINLNSSLYNSISAITNIKLFTDGDFAANTIVALYGIKGVV